MRAALKRLFLFTLLLAISLSACQPKPEPTEPTESMPDTPPADEGSTAQPTQPTLQPSATPSPTIAAEPDDQVLLWASEANASSAAAELGYDAWQAVGEPNTFACGDYVTAWQPDPNETEAWIELAYFPYILPTQIQIVHTFQPGQVSRIELITLDDEVLTVFDAAQSAYLEMPDCPVTRVIDTVDVDVLIRVVRIYLQREAETAWTQIDAVGVLGLVGEELAEPQPPDEGGEALEIGDVHYFTNKNKITSLVFAGGKLWAASLGGVSAWDLDSLAHTTYMASDGLGTNTIYALAYCNWDGGLIAAGSANGVSLLSLDGEPLFEPLGHPYFEDIYGARTLACDPVRRQLWVGYFNQLSRYDFFTQTWQEYGTAEGLPQGMPRTITFIDDDVWVMMEQGIVILRGGKSLESYPPEQSQIPSLFVHAAARDKSGIIWMATSEGLRSQTFLGWRTWTINEIEGGEMTSLLMGLAPVSDGTFWISDHFGTLCRFYPAMQKCVPVVSTPADFTLSALAVDERGWAALGSHDNGVYLYADDEWFHLLTHDQLLDNVIYGLTYTPDGRIWLAGKGGLQYLRASDPNADWGEVPLPYNAVPFSLYTANDGLWVGHTQGATFLPYIGEDVLQLPQGGEEDAVAGTVLVMTKDAAGRIYFGTEKGLSIWDGGAYQYYDLLNERQRASQSYPPRVNCILRDGASIWVGSRSGLHRFENGSLAQSWTGELQSVSTYYNSSVGVIASHPLGQGLLIGIGMELFAFNGEEFEKVLELPSEIRSLFRAPYALLIATASSGVWSVPLDSSAVYWEAASIGADFARNFGYQAIVMSDPYTLWFASMEGGLERRTGMFGQ